MKNRSPMVKVTGSGNKSHAKQDGCTNPATKNPAKKRTRNYDPMRVK